MNTHRWEITPYVGIGPLRLESRAVKWKRRLVGQGGCLSSHSTH